LKHNEIIWTQGTAFSLIKGPSDNKFSYHHKYWTP
jgi:hypothetical protein